MRVIHANPLLINTTYFYTLTLSLNKVFMRDTTYFDNLDL